MEATGVRLPLMEAFYTLQGEGAYQGQAAYFIRLGGCDVGCFWCDVKESWDASAHPFVSVESIVAGAASHPARIAVVTGGEPLLHDCYPLTRALHGAGFRTHVETSGSSPLTGDWDWICLSPKKFKPPVDEVVDRADELKVVVYNRQDFEWAESFAARTPEGCRLFLQPEWGRSDVITPLIVDYIRRHPEWHLSLQIHKYIHVP